MAARVWRGSGYVRLWGLAPVRFTIVRSVQRGVAPCRCASFDRRVASTDSAAMVWRCTAWPRRGRLAHTGTCTHACTPRVHSGESVGTAVLLLCIRGNAAVSSEPLIWISAAGEATEISSERVEGEEGSAPARRAAAGG